MPCCNKKRRIIEARRRVLHEKALQKYNTMQDKDPALLKDTLLLAHHKTIHLLYAGAVTRRPVNKPFVNSTVDLHNTFVNELLNRGTTHNTPLNKI